MGFRVVYAVYHFRPGAVATGQSRENTHGPIVYRSGTGAWIERSGDYLSEQSHECRACIRGGWLARDVVIPGGGQYPLYGDPSAIRANKTKTNALQSHIGPNLLVVCL